MSTTIRRRLWHCPGCGRSVEIPAGTDVPDLCSNCQPAAPQGSGLSPEDRELLRSIAESAAVLKWCGILWMAGAVLGGLWIVAMG